MENEQAQQIKIVVQQQLKNIAYYVKIYKYIFIFNNY